MQRHLAEFRSSFRVVPPLKRQLLAEPSTPLRLCFLISRYAEYEPRAARGMLDSRSARPLQAPSK